ncbi:MAG: DEAD/DEAH box helicase family protein, partial [Candidatus Diapherotrites archaeon]|nr:DEAD/DEAH box helicase family protein [Candidatus Diapherotrites archaeon]
MKVFFPYESVRREQEELVKDIGEAITKGKVFLAHAPTGLGKTVSSLAPAVSYALEKGKKVFFLTPKISQHEIVLETANLMNEKFDLGIKAIDLVGRKQMCVDPFISRVGAGFYEACAKRKKDKTCSYYNNTKGHSPKQKAIALRRKRDIVKDYNNSYIYMKEQCQFKGLCPYEITIEMIKGANIIIGDYSHLFHPDIREGILSPSEISFDDIVLVVDEAHNLPERIRDMMTISFGLDGVEKAGKEAKNVGNFETEFLLKDIEKEILNLGKKLSLEKNEAVLGLNEVEFFKKIARSSRLKIEETADKFMMKNKMENCFLLALNEFLTELLNEKEHTLFVIERKSTLTITIQPLDPADITGDVLSKVHSAVLMSGTLLPLEMFADVLGVTQIDAIEKHKIINEGTNLTEKSTSQNLETTTALALHEKNSLSNNSLQNFGGITRSNQHFMLKEYASPFPKENRLNLIVNKTTTKYTSRNQEQFMEIAKEID